MAITTGQFSEVDTVALARASLVLTPLVLAAAQSGNSHWLLAAIVTISAYIAMDRSGLAPLGVMLHGLAIATGFIALLAALAAPALFVLGCAAMASASVALTGRGARLQSLSSRHFTWLARLPKAPSCASSSNRVPISCRT
jgi:hypothetical protein